HISGQCEATLVNLAPGFFAATGRVGEVVERRPAHLGLPPVAAPTRVASWVEVEAGAGLHARLWHSQVDLPGASLWSRAAGRRVARSDRPVRVAEYPGDESWPPVRAQMEVPTKVR